MTALEHDALVVFRDMVHVLSSRFINRAKYRDTLGEMIKMMKRLELVEDNTCPTGTHASYCECKPAVVGRGSGYYKYHLKYRAKLKEMRGKL